MDRRELLAALLVSPVAAAADLDAQEPAAMDPSLYVPKAHVVADRAFRTISWMSTRSWTS